MANQLQITRPKPDTAEEKESLKQAIETLEKAGWNVTMRNQAGKQIYPKVPKDE